MTVYGAEHMEHSIEKTDGAVLVTGTPDPLFTITGGPILVTEFVGIVTTDIGGTTNCHIDITTTMPATTTTALSTDVAIDSDAAGCSYTFTTGATPVLTPTDNGTLVNVPQSRWLCPIGTIYAHTSTARSGVIHWYMMYKPLSPNSVVTMAA